MGRVKSLQLSPHGPRMGSRTKNLVRGRGLIIQTPIKRNQTPCKSLSRGAVKSLRGRGHGPAVPSRADFFSAAEDFPNSNNNQGNQKPSLFNGRPPSCASRQGIYFRAPGGRSKVCEVEINDRWASNTNLFAGYGRFFSKAGTRGRSKVWSFSIGTGGAKSKKNVTELADPISCSAAARNLSRNSGWGGR
jgi:hypothetical protein